MQKVINILIFIYVTSAGAQISSHLYIDGERHSTRIFSDSLHLYKYITDIQLNWINNGYFFSGIDSIDVRREQTNIFLHKGQKMNAKVGKFKGKTLENHLRQKLKSYVNRGYPFVTFWLDSIRFVDKDILRGEIHVGMGPEITYDSAFFFEKIKTNHSYIYKLLDLVPNDFFSEKSYNNILQKIERSPFMSLNRPTDLSFKGNKAVIFLDIEEKPSSTFQGIFGLQQGQGGETMAIGSVKLDIQNLFRSGKKFRFLWEKFSTSSQELRISYEHPFFLNSKLSPSIRFNLLKQDTTFLTRLAGIGINTYVSPKTQLFFEYERMDGALLSVDIKTLSASGLADFTRVNYSIQFSNRRQFNLDLGNFKKEIAWKISSSVGRKTVDRNVNLPFSYYDTIQSQTNFYRFEANIAYQLPILKRQAFFHSVHVGVLENDKLLKSELYRIGGLNSLRGFNEKSFFAKQYILSRLEFRSFFENNSYAYILYDQLVYKGSIYDYPLGLGLGFALVTLAGQFSFALAIGNSMNQPISFDTLKAHFGYISKF